MLKVEVLNAPNFTSTLGLPVVIEPILALSATPFLTLPSTRSLTVMSVGICSSPGDGGTVMGTLISGIVMLVAVSAARSLACVLIVPLVSRSRKSASLMLESTSVIVGIETSGIAAGVTGVFAAWGSWATD